MPIQTKTTDDGRGIECIFSDIVTGDDIIKVNEEIYNSSTLQQIQYKIGDKSKCTGYKITLEEIKIIANQDMEASRRKPRFLIANITDPDFDFGISKMWQAHIDNLIFLPQTFADRASAISWIQAQLQKRPCPTADNIGQKVAIGS